ncbi:hypothetical protein TanjilG_09077 [Lupinus angustifolius]|uniref:Uncharacterized protein n=1 Tax=Lupinus angustifolius TaxID=3871 RepID=A0A394DF50_LUPAN|nr:PREDICTED: auxin-responsive protein SAUR50-like [Lupinus angustifolius]OIW21740.1 hypothetical protein TanjilG_09077 [Lupinus angustifolius]
MAKEGGKLKKLKSVLKKWNSFTINNNKQSPHTINTATNDVSSSSSSSTLTTELRPVYVGKKRRRYLVSSDVVDHPLFRELVDKSDDDDVEEDTINVACEVVLFQHFLWMLENAHPKPESSDELLEFYA